MTNDQILIGQFLKRQPGTSLDLINELNTKEIVAFVSRQGSAEQQMILKELSSRKAANVMERLNEEVSSELLMKLPFPISESIFRAMASETSDALLQKMPEQLGKMFKRSLSYAKRQVGAHLDPFAMTVDSEITVAKAIKRIQSEDHISGSKVFVLDQNRVLLGYVEISLLITVNPKKLIKKLTVALPFSVSGEMGIKDVLTQWDDRFYEFPVTSIKGEFLGVITKKLLSGELVDDRIKDHSVRSAGSALGDLYLIGLSSLLGSSNKKS